MEGVSSVNLPATDSQNKNVFRQFYESRVFDIAFGVFPAVLVGSSSLILGLYGIYSDNRQPAWDGLAVLSTLALGLITLTVIGCIALLVSIFIRTQLSRNWRAICTAFLCTDILLAVFSISILIPNILVRPPDFYIFSLLALLALAITFAAFKQIRLFSLGGDGAVLRR